MKRFFSVVLLSWLLVACGIAERDPLVRIEHGAGGSQAADISYDGQLSVVSTLDKGISVWSREQASPIFEWSHQGEDANVVTHVGFSFDKSYVVSADADTFAIWNLNNGEPEGLWRIDESSIRDIAISNQGKAILVGRGNGKVMFFQHQSGRRLEFLGHNEKVNSVALSPNGFYALSGGNDYQAYLWDTRSGQVIHAFNHPGRVTKVALDPKGRFAFTADSQKSANIWDVQTGELISQLRFIERQKIFSDVVFSEDGQFLLTGSPSRRITLWNVASGKIEKEWVVAAKDGPAPQSAVVYAVGFVDNARIMSESSSGLAEIWPL